jgi:ribulose-bisphosphate carboxylase large chain
MRSANRIYARYLVETPDAVLRTAEIMAGEQSSGTFVALPLETESLKQRAGAKVESITPFDAVYAPSLPGAIAGPIYHRAEVELSWPFENCGTSLPNLLAMVAGNLFELKPLSGLRILDIEIPAEFSSKYHGPQFGIAGTRRLSGVYNRPLIGTIIKPSVGLSAGETADLVGALLSAGVDFIKDDELQADRHHCPFELRARAVMTAVNRDAERKGRKVMVAFNVTGDLDEMRRRHDLVAALGGTCIMVSLNSIGLVGMVELRRHSRLPIHAHRNGWGYLSRHPLLGWSYQAWSKLWRLAGADHMHVNGLRNKFCELDESVIASAKALTTPLFVEKPYTSMPVFSSSQGPNQVPYTWGALGHPDIIHAAGGGILSHPSGPAAGVKNLREAWDTAMRG